MKEETVTTACGFCVAGCGMKVTLNDDRAVRVEGATEHPVNSGRLCPKGASAIEYAYSPERIKFPMKKVNGEWKRITWDEALVTISAKLLEVRREHGPESLAVCAGMAVLLSGPVGKGLLRRFCDVYGTPNYYSVDSMCFNPHLMAYVSTFGNFPVADIDHAKTVILWGTNPAASQPMKARRIAKAQANGAKVVVIDPRRTASAKKADAYLPIKPGTDCALALGMLNVIISENLYDTAFIDRWTFGFDELAAHVRDFTPEEVQRVTGTPAEKVRQAARLFATSKPACIVQGTMSLDQSRTGFQTARAIAILQAITGNVEKKGGFISPPLLPLRSMRLREMVTGKAIGEYRYPLAYNIWDRAIGEGQGMVLHDALLTGQPYPIRAMIVQGSNPLLSWPNSTKLKQAFEKLDFLVVMSLFMSETAEMADIVLPAGTFLEKEDIIEIYRSESAIPYAMLRKKVIRYEEARSDADFWLELAQRIGFGEHFPWHNTREVVEHLLEPAGIKFDDIGDGLIYGSIEYGRHEAKGFRTPSGKIELFSDTLASFGYDPLPTTELYCGQAADQSYPLTLTTGARQLTRLHSQLQNIDRLRKANPEPFASMHPDTVTQFGITDGDTIRIETETGAIDIRVQVTEDIIPGVVNIPHGWARANANELTVEQPGDPVSGTPHLKSIQCRIAAKVTNPL